MVDQFVKKSEIYLPINEEIVAIRDRHERAHWVKDQVDLQPDINQWKTGIITDEEKNLIRNILLLFTQSDMNVGSGYLDILIPYFQNNEVRMMFSSFATREGEHQLAYAALNDTLGLGESSYNEFLQYSEMSEKNEFMIQPVDSSERSVLEYLAKQTMIEGVSLFASFAMLLSFDRFGKMRGMSEIVQWSMRDESIHVEGNSHLFREYMREHGSLFDQEMRASLIGIMTELVRLEDVFIDKAFEMGGVQGLDPDGVKSYIRFVADYRMSQFNIKTNFGPSENPYPWIDDAMAALDHSNFFERTVVAYSKSALNGNWEDGY